MDPTMVLYYIEDSKVHEGTFFVESINNCKQVPGGWHLPGPDQTGYIDKKDCEKELKDRLIRKHKEYSGIVSGLTEKLKDIEIGLFNIQLSESN